LPEFSKIAFLASPNTNSPAHTQRLKLFMVSVTRGKGLALVLTGFTQDSPYASSSVSSSDASGKIEAK
jgi:hypothetical protein